MNVSSTIEEVTEELPQADKTAALQDQHRAAHINAAVRLLKVGQLVSFPTETVYGLGGDAGNPVAIRRIFRLKGRPENHPLIVHLADAGQLNKWARHIPPVAWKLAERFWPGPLTLILKKAAGVLPLVTGGQDTIGLRVPAHPLALELLRAFGGGLAAPSANRFGRVSPTCPDHVRAEFTDKLPLVLDGGCCRVGVESTILSLVTEEPVLLRPGGISVTELAEVLGCRPSTQDTPVGDIRVPGLLTSHYATLTPLEVVNGPGLWLRVKQLRTQGVRVACMTLDQPPLEISHTHRKHIINMPNEPQAYARGLYRVMRNLDCGNYDLLLVEAPPQIEKWSAINNRLQRAAAREIVTGETANDSEQFEHSTP
jgi:L-threonylcarbamoyladenylate synthase